MKTLANLSDKAAMISHKLVNCRGCTICCKRGGLVYVLNQEGDRLRSIGVPLITIDGINFIKRLQDGSCPMLDQIGNKCSVYEDRPLCCRLYPFDALSIDGRLQWALATLCPEDRKCFETWQELSSKIGFGSIARIASNFENFLDKADVIFFRKKELVSRTVEILDDDQNGWIPLAEI